MYADLWDVLFSDVFRESARVKFHWDVALFILKFIRFYLALLYFALFLSAFPFLFPSIIVHWYMLIYYTSNR